MTPEQKDVLAHQIEVMQGALDGKTIEWRWVVRQFGDAWYPLKSGFSFAWDEKEYRIKPEVKTFNVYNYIGAGPIGLYSYLAGSLTDDLAKRHPAVYKLLKSFDVEL